MMVQRQLMAREQSSRDKLVSSLTARCNPLFQREALCRWCWRVGWHCWCRHRCGRLQGGHLWRGHACSVAYKCMVWCGHLWCGWRGHGRRGLHGGHLRGHWRRACFHVLRWRIALCWHLRCPRQTTVTCWRRGRQCCTGWQLGRWCSAEHCKSVNAASDFFAVCDEFHSFMIEIYAGDIATRVRCAVARDTHKVATLDGIWIVHVCAIHKHFWRERRR